ncbi:MAG: ABC transporter permease [Cytophagaceae bacterium]|jgi:lipoprotein-releasing system permease protein|nr:ABC transporter permease [Cytophagaceae bacterium]
MFRTVFFVARKYYFSGKQLLLINVVSSLSVLVIAGITMALVIIMSVFNGMENLIRSLYQSFDPALKIVPYTGKTFSSSDTLIRLIQTTPGVVLVTEVIEDNAVLSYKNESDVIKLKGVSDNFFKHRRLDSFLVEGELNLFTKDTIPMAIIGRGVQYKLMIKLKGVHPLVLYYPDKNKIKNLTSLETFNTGVLHAGGVFAIEKQYDDNYVIIPISFAQNLLQYDQERTSFELKVSDEADIEEVQANLKTRLGNKYKVLNNDEQHASLLKAIRTEKIVVNFMLGFILVLSSVGIFFCLTMLTLTKRKDIAVLKTIGWSTGSIRSLFILLGGWIATSGALLGALIGFLVCKLQEKYGLISIGMESSVVESYPVEVRWSDISTILLWVGLITFISSIRPAILASKIPIKSHL